MLKEIKFISYLKRSKFSLTLFYCFKFEKCQKRLSDDLFLF